jgi:hypothetical protein
MKLYTKCTQCEEELSFDSSTCNVDNGVVINEEVLCLQCCEKESKELIEAKQKLLNKIGLGDEHKQTQMTQIKDNVLYIITNIGVINKEYYGTDDYTFIINTLTGQMAICKNGEQHIYLDKATPIGAISNIISVMKFMCD